MLVFSWFLILEKMENGGQDGDHDWWWWRHKPPGGGGGMTLRVCPGAKNSRTPDHRLHCLTKSSLTLFTPCPLPDGGKLSLSDRWLRTGPVVRSYASRERNYEKLWWTKFKIKRFASGCDGTWDFRNIEGKDKKKKKIWQGVKVIFMGCMSFELGRSASDSPAFPYYLVLVQLHSKS